MRTVKGYVVRVARGVRAGAEFRFMPKDGSQDAVVRAGRSAHRKVDRLDAEYGACCASVVILWDGELGG